MPWNWELPNWPQFSYHLDQIAPKERQFLLEVGSACAFLKNIGDREYSQFVIEILSLEGLESSRIEGEFLDRESLQSSIKQHFSLRTPLNQETKKESRMAKLLCDVYQSFDQPLTQEMLFKWHFELFHNQSNSVDCGRYRTHTEPMQLVSHRYGSSKVFFEAPPSVKVPDEMAAFINWFNSTNASILGKAAIAHVYFESIHPFEDGNGRIGRVLVEKVLSQGIGHPILIAISKVLEKQKKEYYAVIGRCNRTLEIDHWMAFFADAILQAQAESMNLLYFLIEKSKLLTALSGQLNPRQEKVLAEGLNGFKGGLSADNYIVIAKTSRATATRDLADLIHKKALVRTGELRHTRYWLNLPKN